jgi:exosortase
VLADCWRQLPHRAWFILLVSVWIALFQFLGNSTFGYIDTSSLFLWMFNAYNAPLSEDGHGNLIPFVILGLFWWKRKELLALPKRQWWPALIGLAGALGLHLIGYRVQQPRISIIGFFTGLLFLIGLAWGRGVLKASLFPFILFVFCIPISSLAEGLSFPLRLVSTEVTIWIAHWVLGIDVIQDGVRILDPNGAYNYEVAAACSGIRSLITLLALTTIYGFVVFERTWKRLLTIALAPPLAVAGNVLRLTAVIMTAEAFGQQAGERVHDWVGFVTFALALVCLLLVGGWLREEKPSCAL